MTPGVPRNPTSLQRAVGVQPGRGALQKKVHIREDPEGGVPRHARSACSGAKRRCSRREAAAGRVVPRVHLGDGGAPRAEHASAGRSAGTQSLQHAMRKAEESWNVPRYKAWPRTFGTQLCSGDTRSSTSFSGRPDTQRDGSDRAVESGRPPTGGPVRSDRERTPFFPSHSVLRTSFHYGKNDLVLSGIGTDRPARRRPAALDRPGTPGRARARRAPAGARGDMN